MAPQEDEMQMSEPERKRFWVYMVRCKDDTIYTGYTSDLKRRIDQHNAGTGSRYTRARIPVKLVWTDEFATRRQAMRREIAIKRLGRPRKLKMVEKWRDSTSEADGDGV